MFKVIIHIFFHKIVFIANQSIASLETRKSRCPVVLLAVVAFVTVVAIYTENKLVGCVGVLHILCHFRCGQLT